MPKFQKKDAPAVPPVPTVSVRAAVIERRKQNPFGDGSPDISLKDGSMATHIINTSRPGRYHDVVRNKGWEPVKPEQVDGDPADFGFDVANGRVVRGERGSEVLMQMPAADFRDIQMAKDAKNRESVSPKRLRAAVVEATGAAMGDQAAEYMATKAQATIRDERAPVPLEDGEGPPAA